MGRRHGLPGAVAGGRSDPGEAGDLPPFRTYQEIESTVARGGLSPREGLWLWVCLCLSPAEVGELLALVRERSVYDVTPVLHALPAYAGMRQALVRVGAGAPMTTPAPPTWDGARLGTAYLALVVLTRDAPAPGGVPGPVLAGASNGPTACVVPPVHLGRSLGAHAAAQLVCPNAGELHRVLHAHLGASPDPAAQQALWRLVAAGRLVDVSLLGQLVRLAEAGCRRPPRLSLQQLAKDRAGLPLRDEEELRQATASTPHAAAALAAEAVCQVKAVVQVFEAWWQQVQAAGLAVTGEGQNRFGLPSLALQVQGDVALAPARHDGLHFSTQELQQIMAGCLEARTRSETRLAEGREASRCFKTRPGNKITGRPSGLPEVKHRALGAWLTGALASVKGLHSTDFTSPIREDGRVSVAPEDWGVLVRRDPLLRAWSDLMTVPDVARSCASAAASALRPRYEVLPPIRSSGPDLNALRRLCGTGLLSGTPAQARNVPQTEARAYAASHPAEMPAECSEQLDGFFEWAYEKLAADELHFEYGCELLKKFLRERELVRPLRDFLRDAGEGPVTNLPTVLKEVQEREAAIEQLGGGLRSMAGDWGAFQGYLNTCRGRALIGLRTGMPWLDERALGLRGLIAVGARPGLGKTAWLSQLGLNVVRHNDDAIFLLASLEMPRDSLYARLVCSQAGVDWKTLVLGSPSLRGNANGPWFTPQDHARIVEANAALEGGGLGSRIFILDQEALGPDFTAQTALAYLEQAKAATQKTRALIGVDYLQLLPAPNLADLDADRHRVQFLKELLAGTRTGANPAGDCVLVISEMRQPSGKQHWHGQLADFMGSARLPTHSTPPSCSAGWRTGAPRPTPSTGRCSAFPRPARGPSRRRRWRRSCSNWSRAATASCRGRSPSPSSTRRPASPRSSACPATAPTSTPLPPGARPSARPTGCRRRSPPSTRTSFDPVH